MLPVLYLSLVLSDPNVEADRLTIELLRAGLAARTSCMRSFQASAPDRRSGRRVVRQRHIRRPWDGPHPRRG